MSDEPRLAHVLTEQFSEIFADVYDEVYPSTGEEYELVEFVGSFVEPGSRVLDVGIGTGRLALPLAEAGFHVHGVELSKRMLEHLRAKDGADQITTTHGDVSAVEQSGFPVALMTYNVLLCALSHEDQLQMLGELRRRVADDGYLVVQTFDPTGFHGRTIDETRTLLIPSGGALIESTAVHARAQHLTTTIAIVGHGDETPTSTTVLRYLWPSELDLLAGIAGFDLVERFSDWRRSEFRGGTPGEMVVSVYQAQA